MSLAPGTSVDERPRVGRPPERASKYSGRKSLGGRGLGRARKSLAKLTARRREYSVKEQDALQVATEDRISADIYAIDGTTLKQEQERKTPLRLPKSSNWPH